MEVCMFCKNYERDHPKEVEYVCSNCVIILMRANQEDKIKAYNKAIKINSLKQAESLLMFITEDINEERDTDRGVKSKRLVSKNTNRGGSFKRVRN